jgi:hypothetical protein
MRRRQSRDRQACYTCQKQTPVHCSMCEVFNTVARRALARLGTRDISGSVCLSLSLVMRLPFNITPSIDI